MKKAIFLLIGLPHFLSPTVHAQSAQSLQVPEDVQEVFNGLDSEDQDRFEFLVKRINKSGKKADAEVQFRDLSVDLIIDGNSYSGKIGALEVANIKKKVRNLNVVQDPSDDDLKLMAKVMKRIVERRLEDPGVKMLLELPARHKFAKKARIKKLLEVQSKANRIGLSREQIRGIGKTFGLWEITKNPKVEKSKFLSQINKMSRSESSDLNNENVDWLKDDLAADMVKLSKHLRVGKNQKWNLAKEEQATNDAEHTRGIFTPGIE